MFSRKHTQPGRRQWLALLQERKQHTLVAEISFPGQNVVAGIVCQIPAVARQCGTRSCVAGSVSGRRHVNSPTFFQRRRRRLRISAEQMVNPHHNTDHGGVREVVIAKVNHASMFPSASPATHHTSICQKRPHAMRTKVTAVVRCLFTLRRRR